MPGARPPPAAPEHPALRLPPRWAGRRGWAGMTRGICLPTTGAQTQSKGAHARPPSRRSHRAAETRWGRTFLVPRLHGHGQVAGLDLALVHGERGVLAHEAGQDVGAACDNGRRRLSAQNAGRRPLLSPLSQERALPPTQGQAPLLFRASPKNPRRAGEGFRPGRRPRLPHPGGCFWPRVLPEELKPTAARGRTGSQDPGLWETGTSPTRPTRGHRGAEGTRVHGHSRSRPRPRRALRALPGAPTQQPHLRWSPAARCSSRSGTRTRSSAASAGSRWTARCAASAGCGCPLGRGAETRAR